MPLNLAELGKLYTIHRIGGQEKERHHLENLGLIPGQELRLISEFHGYYIVSVKDTRIGIENIWLRRSFSWLSNSYIAIVYHIAEVLCIY